MADERNGDPRACTAARYCGVSTHWLEVSTELFLSVSYEKNTNR